MTQIEATNIFLSSSIAGPNSTHVESGWLVAFTGDSAGCQELETLDQNIRKTQEADPQIRTPLGSLLGVVDPAPGFRCDLPKGSYALRPLQLKS